MAELQLGLATLEFNPLDYKQFDAYESGLLEMQEKLNKLKVTKFEKQSTYILKSCETVFEWLNGIFGDNASNEIFGDSVDLAKCFEVVFDLTNWVKENSALQISELDAKYMPNRTLKVVK